MPLAICSQDFVDLYIRNTNLEAQATSDPIQLASEISSEASVPSQTQRAQLLYHISLYHIHQYGLGA